MLPPPATSMRGNRVVSRTSPATTTSDRRKKTMLSPSVCAAGWCNTSIPSSFRYMYLRRCGNVSVGHAAVGNGDCCPVGALIRVKTFSADRMAAAPLLVMLSLNGLLVLNSVRPAFAIRSFPPTWSGAALVSMTERMGWGDSFLIAGTTRAGLGGGRCGQFLERRAGEVTLGGRAGIDDDHAVLAGLDTDVRAGPTDHVEVGTDLEHFQIACVRAAGVLTLLRAKHGRQQQPRHERRRPSAHGFELLPSLLRRQLAVLCASAAQDVRHGVVPLVARVLVNRLGNPLH